MTLPPQWAQAQHESLTYSCLLTEGGDIKIHSCILRLHFRSANHILPLPDRDGPKSVSFPSSYQALYQKMEQSQT